MMIGTQIYIPRLDPEEDLRQRLADLMMRREDLLSHILRDVRAEYMMKVGAKEHLVMKKRIELSMAKHRLELIRQSTNRAEEPDMEMIEKELDHRFKEYTEEIHRRAEEMRKILRHMDAEILTDEESK